LAKFCTKCGAALTGIFCIKCGADMRQSANPAPQPVPQNAVSIAPEAPPSLSAVPPSPSTSKKMSPLAKLGIAAVIVVFAGGALAAGGIYYAVHRVSEKIHEETGGLLGSSSGSDDSSNNAESSASANSSDNSLGDVCRFLSKEDVSKAIGVTIIRAQALDNDGCNYIAKGTQADMMAKHATAMAATRGANKETQQVLQQVAGGMFKVFQSENKDKAPDTGEIPVFNFSVDQNNAEAQMRLNKKGLGRMGEMQDLPGIGDQAFVSADGMLMFRKGTKLVRIMYLTCPCGTEAVKPLAKELADSL
jgi:hypothetical protein